jgi:hypothetical protein
MTIRERLGDTLLALAYKIYKEPRRKSTNRSPVILMQDQGEMRSTGLPSFQAHAEAVKAACSHFKRLQASSERTLDLYRRNVTKTYSSTKPTGYVTVYDPRPMRMYDRASGKEIDTKDLNRRWSFYQREEDHQCQDQEDSPLKKTGKLSTLKTQSKKTGKARKKPRG